MNTPRHLIRHSLLTVIFAIAVTAHAQVPQIINYQGRIAVGAVNFDGTGLFKFALVNANGSTTYWSNDGTSSAGSQPTAAVTLPVSKGLYSVQLGDTALANMTAIPASVFTNADVRLRVWFNDGVNGSQLLSPDQRIAAVGYAMMAGGVNLPATASATVGVVAQNGTPLIHTFGPGGENIFAGTGAGNFNLSASSLTAVGASALQSNTTGESNTAVGFGALQSNTQGWRNTAVGYHALNNNTTGYENTALGDWCLHSNTTGIDNTAVGFQCLYSNTTGIHNIGIGSFALNYNTSANHNVAVGYNALANQSFSNGGTPWNSFNVAVGYRALESNQPASTSTGIYNTAVGPDALHANTIGNHNVAVGSSAILNNTTGLNNVGIGHDALLNNTIGNSNIAVGLSAGSALTSGSNNIAIGNVGVAGESNVIRIGSSQTDTYLAGVVHGNGSGLTGITAASLAGGSVTSTQIAPGAVGSTQLASDLTLGGMITASGGLSLSATSSSTVGVIMQNGSSLIHSYGTNNFFAGIGAGNFIMTGTDNTAIGFNALHSNTTSGTNTAIGASALSSNTTGSRHTAIGYQALYSNNTGIENTATGYQALQANTSGYYNTACGYQALQFNTTANSNTASGWSTLLKNTNGGSNTAVGRSALQNNSAASQNVAVGRDALFTQSFSNAGSAWNSSNVAVGFQALFANQPTSTGNGINNSALGTNALAANTTGSSNIALGYGAGNALTTGDNNIDIGNAGVAAESNTIRIGTAQTAAYVVGISGQTSSGGAAVFINSSGKLGTTTSSRRFKDDILSMDKASEVILSLRPVTFRYKSEIDPLGFPQFGLIAEEVAEIAPDLVVRDEKGAINTVRYEQVNAMLLNEFLKDHQRVNGLRAENAEMKKRLAELEARDKEREARLSKLEQFIPPAPTTNSADATVKADSITVK